MHTAPGADLAEREAVAQLRAEVVSLRSEVMAIRQQLGSRAGGIRGPAVVGDPPELPISRDEQARVERQRDAATESAFRGEAVDENFRLRATSGLRDAFATADDALRGEVRSIECRARSCRVEIAGDDTGATERALPVVLSRLAQTLPNATAAQVDRGDGRRTTVLYLTR